MAFCSLGFGTFLGLSKGFSVGFGNGLVLFQGF